jgi:hypothetical protein
VAALMVKDLFLTIQTLIEPAVVANHFRFKL